MAADNLSIEVVADEPGRLIVRALAQGVALRAGVLRRTYHYYARLNDGDWVELAPNGNRIPEGW